VRRGLVFLFVLVALAACAPVRQEGPRKPVVVVTTTQIQDWTRNVGGDRIELVGILDPSADPHEYQPTAVDARNVARADVLIANGLGLEGGWFQALAKNAPPDAQVIELAKLVSGQAQPAGPHESEGDPHVWQDPTNVRKMVPVIRDALARADPAGKATYEQNAAAYDAQLAELDRDIEAQIDTIPPANRKLVTNHNAFGYYARRYGLTVVGSVVPSLTTDAEPSAAETRRLIEAIKAQGVRAIYTESNLNPKLEQQIAREAGVRVYPNLYGDALGPPGSDGDTYLKAMRHNTRMIVEGLRG
jgi:ABC-type Zn uptake system ZnuABC Zn-binding protein ZnuA